MDYIKKCILNYTTVNVHIGIYLYNMCHMVTCHFNFSRRKELVKGAWSEHTKLFLEPLMTQGLQFKTHWMYQLLKNISQ